MSESLDQVERLLEVAGRRFERLPDDTIVVASAGRTPIALRLASPVLVATVVIGDVPAEGEGPLLRRLLELNAGALLHAAYGLVGRRIELSAALESQNLDLNELTAVLDDFDAALSEQVPELVHMLPAAPPSGA